jgi:hypothetical protein
VRCNQPSEDENLIEPRVNIDSTGDVITVARAVLRIPVLRAWYVAHHALCGSQRIRGLHAVLDHRSAAAEEKQRPAHRYAHLDVKRRVLHDAAKLRLLLLRRQGEHESVLSYELD